MIWYCSIYNLSTAFSFQNVLKSSHPDRNKIRRDFVKLQSFCNRGTQPKQWHREKSFHKNVVGVCIFFQVSALEQFLFRFSLHNLFSNDSHCGLQAGLVLKVFGHRFVNDACETKFQPVESSVTWGAFTSTSFIPKNKPWHQTNSKLRTLAKINYIRQIPHTSAEGYRGLYLDLTCVDHMSKRKQILQITEKHLRWTRAGIKQLLDCSSPWASASIAAPPF